MHTEIRVVLPPKPKSVSFETGLQLIGSFFTGLIIKREKEKKPSVANFSVDAETCYQELCAWRQRTNWVHFPLLLSLLTGLLCIVLKDSNATWCVGLGITCVLLTIASYKQWRYTQQFYPGKTAIMVGKAWEKCYNRNTSDVGFNVIFDFTERLRKKMEVSSAYWNNVAGFGFQQHNHISVMLRLVINNMLDVHAGRVLDAERDGKPQNKKVALDAMKNLSKFGKGFGMEFDWSENYTRARRNQT